MNHLIIKLLKFHAKIILILNSALSFYYYLILALRLLVLELGETLALMFPSPDSKSEYPKVCLLFFNTEVIALSLDVFNQHFLKQTLGQGTKVKGMMMDSVVFCFKNQTSIFLYYCKKNSLGDPDNQ